MLFRKFPVKSSGRKGFELIFFESSNFNKIVKTAHYISEVFLLKNSKAEV